MKDPNYQILARVYESLKKIMVVVGVLVVVVVEVVVGWGGPDQF